MCVTIPLYQGFVRGRVNFIVSLLDDHPEIVPGVAICDYVATVTYSHFTNQQKR